MLDQFLDFLHSFVALNSKDRELVRQVLQIKNYKKGSFLLAEGEISTAFFFNLKGLIRLFYNRTNGEKTAYFYPENTFISAYESFTRQKPSKLNFQAMAETTVVVISAQAAQTLLAHDPKFDMIARVIMEEEMIAHQRIIESLLTLSPEERYFQLLDENPDIFQRVSQHYIASYIGVAPESLSRIKKRHFNRKS